MKTGFKNLDEKINIDGQKLIILGSRPAMGKSTLALNIVSNIAIRQNEAVLYFNLESSKEEIVSKMIISNGMVEYKKFKQSKNTINDEEKLQEELTEEDWDRIAYGTELIKESKIFIETKANITIDEICETSKKLKQEQNINLIVIDYLQLIAYTGKEALSREIQISEILKKLKILSKELNIPILVTSQLSREPEKRENHRPMLSDFSESNQGIASHADIVLLLYRDDYYDTNTPKRNIAEIIIAKSSQGKTTTVEVAWMPEYIKFGNVRFLGRTTKSHS